MIILLLPIYIFFVYERAELSSISIDITNTKLYVFNNFSCNALSWMERYGHRNYQNLFVNFLVTRGWLYSKTQSWNYIMAFITIAFFYIGFFWDTPKRFINRINKVNLGFSPQKLKNFGRLKSQTNEMYSKTLFNVNCEPSFMKKCIIISHLYTISCDQKHVLSYLSKSTLSSRESY